MSGYHKRDFEPFPVHALKRVERPTTKILDDEVQRVDERESGFNKASRGDYGSHLQKERARFVPKHPVSGALSWMTAHLRDVVGAAVVTTDLPLVVDKPVDFGLQDYCSKCKKCAKECPSGALSFDGKVMHNGYERWPSDVEKCTSMRVGNKRGSGCGTCIKVCPWNKPYTPLHRAVSWVVRHSSLARGISACTDDLFGYGKPHPEKKWWLDLEEVGGRLENPSGRGD